MEPSPLGSVLHAADTISTKFSLENEVVDTGYISPSDSVTENNYAFSLDDGISNSGESSHMRGNFTYNLETPESFQSLNTEECDDLLNSLSREENFDDAKVGHKHLRSSKRTRVIQGKQADRSDTSMQHKYSAHISQSNVDDEYNSNHEEYYSLCSFVSQDSSVLSAILKSTPVNEDNTIASSDSKESNEKCKASRIKRENFGHDSSLLSNPSIAHEQNNHNEAIASKKNVEKYGTKGNQTGKVQSKIENYAQSASQPNNTGPLNDRIDYNDNLLRERENKCITQEVGKAYEESIEQNNKSKGSKNMTCNDFTISRCHEKIRGDINSEQKIASEQNKETENLRTGPCDELVEDFLVKNQEPHYPSLTYQDEKGDSESCTKQDLQNSCDKQRTQMKLIENQNDHNRDDNKTNSIVVSPSRLSLQKNEDASDIQRINEKKIELYHFQRKSKHSISNSHNQENAVKTIETRQDLNEIELNSNDSRVKEIIMKFEDGTISDANAHFSDKPSLCEIKGNMNFVEMIDELDLMNNERIKAKDANCETPITSTIEIGRLSPKSYRDRTSLLESKNEISKDESGMPSVEKRKDFSVQKKSYKKKYISNRPAVFNFDEVEQSSPRIAESIDFFLGCKLKKKHNEFTGKDNEKAKYIPYRNEAEHKVKGELTELTQNHFLKFSDSKVD